MLSNEEIVSTIELTAKLLELHGEDEVRVKTYNNAAYNLDKFPGNLSEMDFGQLVQIQGVGKMMAGKIIELTQTNKLKELDELLSITPKGLLDMFKIKGLGVKKIKILWKDFDISNLSELQSACELGNIAKIKGFGEKTQVSILESLVFIKSQEGKLRMDKALILAEKIIEILKKYFVKVEHSGQIRRKSEVVDCLVFMAGFTGEIPDFSIPSFTQNKAISSPFNWRGHFEDFSIPIEIKFIPLQEFAKKQFIYTANPLHLKQKNTENKTLYSVASGQKDSDIDFEEKVYEKFGVPYIIPEMREGNQEFEWIKKNKNEDLVTWNDLKGILHNHSTYSDGKNSLEEMAIFCKSLGFEYLGIADHSQTASYANGLLITKVQQQHQEIEQLNKKLSQDKPFKIFKGIESDILGDGSLDYPDEILASFDFIVASIHSNLSMNSVKATERLIKAIENPYTTILGHPSGRLLLSRQGYPFDYQAVIDCCAENQVAIEINASPYRLDLDWRWIEYALDKNVLLSINPDAHETQGYFDMHFGVAVARKGGLVKQMTLNTFSATTFEQYLYERKQSKKLI